MHFFLLITYILESHNLHQITLVNMKIVKPKLSYCVNLYKVRCKYVDLTLFVDVLWLLLISTICCYCWATVVVVFICPGIGMRSITSMVKNACAAARQLSSKRNTQSKHKRVEPQYTWAVSYDFEALPQKSCSSKFSLLRVNNSFSVLLYTHTRV